MKNICKFLGIIAAVAVIGFVTSCGEPDPEDRIEIQITGLPSGANGYYSRVSLAKAAADFSATGSLASSSARKPIRNSTTTSEMVQSGKNFADAGSYIVRLEIYQSETPGGSTETSVYDGMTSGNRSIIKGTNVINVDLFTPDIFNVAVFKPTTPEQPPANNFGNYTTTYLLTSSGGNVTETVALSQAEFKISDTTNDSLTFEISKWETIPAASLPTEATSGGYTGGYKFTGKITQATSGYVPSLKTAPGFTMATDVKADKSGPECYMSIYFKGDTGSITFIRTPFSKTNGTANSGVVTGDDNNVRVYTKP